MEKKREEKGDGLKEGERERKEKRSPVLSPVSVQLMKCPGPWGCTCPGFVGVTFHR